MKKNKRLILHIGTVKTGTSSIQESLGRARDVLLKYNIHYQSIQPYNHIFTFPPIFVKKPQKIDWFRRGRLQPFETKEMRVQGYVRDWQKEFMACGGNDDFIISAEHLSAGFFKEEAVERLKEFVEAYFEQVTVIVYVRHYDSWIASEVQQRVKNGFPAAGLSEMVQRLQNCPPGMSYRASLQKWVNVFGRESIVVRPFDPHSFYNQSLLADFFHACGLPANDISIPEIRVNESISGHAVVFLQKYNQAYPLYVDGSINLKRGLIRDGIPFLIYNKLDYDKFKLDPIYSPQQAQTVNNEIDYVNQFFADGYQFQHVSPGDGETLVPGVNDIPVDFFVELINNYNKKIESQRRSIENLRKQNVYFQKIHDMMKIPLFLRVIDRLPRLKALLKKIVARFL